MRTAEARPHSGRTFVKKKEVSGSTAGTAAPDDPPAPLFGVVVVPVPSGVVIATEMKKIKEKKCLMALRELLL